MAAASVAEIGTFVALTAVGIATANARSEDGSATAAVKGGPFGKVLRSQFMLVDDVVHINNGSYGAVPASVRARRRELLDEIEAYPDRFLRKQAVARFTAVCDEVGSWLKAPPGATAMVSNATTGVNAALLSIDFKPGDKILCFQETYNACRNAVYEACRRFGAQAVVSTLPIVDASDDELVARVDAVLDKHPETRVVLIDHITSPTAVVLPAERLCKLCRDRGILSIVDGAHAPGLLELDLAAINADWYSGNLHKWVFAPRSCAVLVASEGVRKQTRPVVTSHFWPSSSLQRRFYMQGTSDQSRYLAAPAGIAFLESLGGVPAVAAFQHQLLTDAVTAMRTIWKVPKDADTEATGGDESVAGMEGIQKRIGDLLCPLSRCKGMCCIRTPLDPQAFMKESDSDPAAAGGGGGGLSRLEAPPGWATGDNEIIVSAAVATSGCDSEVGSATGTLAPPALATGTWAEAELDSGLPERIARVLFQIGKVQAQTFVLRGAVWLRLSAAVYNTVSDYETVARTIATAVTRAEALGNARGCLLEGDALDV